MLRENYIHDFRTLFMCAYILTSDVDNPSQIMVTFLWIDFFIKLLTTMLTMPLWETCILDMYQEFNSYTKWRK